MKYSIFDIAGIVDAVEVSLINPNAEVSILLTDSRSLSEPNETLFFALITEHNDGHKYILDLHQKGTRNFVIQYDFPEKDNLTDANFLKVENTLNALQKLAAFHRRRYSIPVIGITGSNGKTVVKEWLYQLLHDTFSIVRSPRSYNSQIGVPLSIWQLNNQTQLGIIEAGISLPGEMNKIEPIVRPSIGVFTTLGDSHQENFSSQEEKCLEKLTLFKSSEKIIYNEDQPLVKYCIERKGYSDKAFSWSTKNQDASLYIHKIDKEEDSTFISYRWKKNQDDQLKYECAFSTLKIPFTDDASIEDAIHCLAFILCFIPALEHLEQKFEKLEPVAMRLDVSTGMNGNILINDTYNSDINSLSIALDFMHRRSDEKHPKRIVILSDILQSGMLPITFYKKVADLIHQKEIDYIIGIGPDLMSQSSLFRIRSDFFPSTEEFLASGVWRELKNSIILIKGSRKSRFERISEQLEEKAHQTVLEVNLDAVIHNLKYLTAKLKPQTKVICMVKAFGYGIGSYELAKTLQDRGADYLAVALADEGAELRREGITMPIIVMNPEKHAFNTLLEYNLEPEIYNENILNSIIKETERRGIVHYPIHIKLDTGMNRLGFSVEQIPAIAEKIIKQDGIFIKSVFSHLAASDSPVLDDFTEAQIKLFTEKSQELENLLGYSILRHILNSAGIERFPEAQFDMVRLGIGLYGISASQKDILQPVAILKTKILQIRDVKKDNTVGYGRKGVLEKDSRIAILPIGYADGFDRRLGNGNIHLLVNGCLAPTVGNICMDISMIDVTGVTAKEGDEVIVFGEEISITQIADKLNTIPYEILTSISPRVKRIYYKE